MHNLEPHYNWRHLYITSEDDRSPFYGYQNSEVYFTHQIYDHVIHPQWDDMGSETLFLKILYADYEDGFAIMEFMGEWNDCINNDIMVLKRDIVDPMLKEGIQKFILIGENVLNFHASDELYYEEWFEDVEDGWIALVNFRDHVLREMKRTGIDSYVAEGGELSDISWRKKGPEKLFAQIDGLVGRRLGLR
jgi:hypothetical protein